MNTSPCISAMPLALRHALYFSELAGCFRIVQLDTDAADVLFFESNSTKCEKTAAMIRRQDFPRSQSVQRLREGGAQ